jgi:hypothetical protein
LEAARGDAVTTANPSRVLDEPVPSAVVVRQVAAFEERYGLGSHQRLLRRLAHPCVTFARIATEFGVSRERVRQWQQVWLPAAPRGLERRRECRVRQQKRRLLEEPLFRSFYDHVRPLLAAARLSFVPSAGGFRKREVRLDGRTVVLKTTRPFRHPHGAVVAYALTTYRGAAEFIYFRLGEEDFLFLPSHLLPPTGTTFVDTPSSKYQRFKNTIAALEPAPEVA